MIKKARVAEVTPASKQDRPFDYFYDKIWKKWYEVKAVPHAMELDASCEVVKNQIKALKGELKQLPVNELEYRETTKAEIADAIKGGLDLTNFESSTAKAFDEKKRKLEKSIAEKELIFEALNAAREEAWLTAYDEELGYLKPALEKARLKKIHDELVTSGHDFDGWQHTKYDLTGIPDKAIGLVVAELNKRP